jgi:hypothetical protein
VKTNVVQGKKTLMIFLSSLGGEQKKKKSSAPPQALQPGALKSCTLLWQSS